MLISTSITGDELLIRQKNKPTQFLFLEGSQLRNYLLRKSQIANIYMSRDAYSIYASVLNGVPLFVVHPSHTRHDEATNQEDSKKSTNRGSSSGSSNQGSSNQKSSKQSSSNQGSSQRAPSPPVVDLDSSEDEADAAPPPLGMYEWIEANNKELEDIVCKKKPRSDYLRQTRETRTNCDTNTFDALSQRLNDCTSQDSVAKCVKKLLRFVHPDKLSDREQKCGQSISQNLNEVVQAMSDRERAGMCPP